MARKFFPVLVLALVFGFLYVPDSFDPKLMNGKRVLITCADDSNIGEELSYQYSKLGVTVVLSGHSEVALKKIASKCTELGAKKVTYVVADLEHPEERLKLVSNIEKDLGGLDHLILNHATGERGFWIGSAKNMSVLLRENQVNFVSYVDLASKLLKMLSVSKGNIGVVSPMAAKIGSPAMASLTANRFAVHGFFSALRQEFYWREVDVSVTLCVLGSFDDHNVVAKWLGRFMTFTLPATSTIEEAATTVLTGVTVKSHEVYFPSYSSFLLQVHKFLPIYTERYLASRSLN